jgi:hypothetical protein
VAQKWGTQVRDFMTDVFGADIRSRTLSRRLPK